MFGLIRYKSNDFSGNSSSDSEIYAVLFVILDISLMSHIRVTREYKLHGLSELINLDKSCN